MLQNSKTPAQEQQQELHTLDDMTALVTEDWKGHATGRGNKRTIPAVDEERLNRLESSERQEIANRDLED